MGKNNKDIEAYLSRDLRKVIQEVLTRNGYKPTYELVEDIYDLVIVEATDVQFRALESKIDRIVHNLSER